MSEELYAFALLLLTAGDSHAGLQVKALFTAPAHVEMMMGFFFGPEKGTGSTAIALPVNHYIKFHLQRNL